MGKIADILLISATAFLLFTGCRSASKMTARGIPGASHRHSAVSTASAGVRIDSSLPVTSQALLSEAESWIGVPYSYGGSDRNGVDCSGFVTQVYLNALDIKLPRTSSSQCDFCSDVAPAAILPGDLLFFDTTRSRDGRVSHVGLYIGDGNMIHASQNKGVTVSAVTESYFSERLLKIGRVAAMSIPARTTSSAANREIVLNRLVEQKLDSIYTR